MIKRFSSRPSCSSQPWFLFWSWDKRLAISNCLIQLISFFSRSFNLSFVFKCSKSFIKINLPVNTCESFIFISLGNTMYRKSKYMMTRVNLRFNIQKRVWSVTSWTNIYKFLFVSIIDILESSSFTKSWELSTDYILYILSSLFYSWSLLTSSGCVINFVSSIFFMIFLFKLFV